MGKSVLGEHGTTGRRDGRVRLVQDLLQVLREVASTDPDIVWGTGLRRSTVERMAKLDGFGLARLARALSRSGGGVIITPSADMLDFGESDTARHCAARWLSSGDSTVSRLNRVLLRRELADDLAESSYPRTCECTTPDCNCRWASVVDTLVATIRLDDAVICRHLSAVDRLCLARDLLNTGATASVVMATAGLSRRAVRSVRNDLRPAAQTGSGAMPAARRLDDEEQAALAALWRRTRSRLQSGDEATVLTAVIAASGIEPDVVVWHLARLELIEHPEQVLDGARQRPAAIKYA